MAPLLFASEVELSILELEDVVKPQAANTAAESPMMMTL